MWVFFALWTRCCNFINLHSKHIRFLINVMLVFYLSLENFIFSYVFSTAEKTCIYIFKGSNNVSVKYTTTNCSLITLNNRLNTIYDSYILFNCLVVYYKLVLFSTLFTDSYKKHV